MRYARVFVLTVGWLSISMPAAAAPSMEETLSRVVVEIEVTCPSSTRQYGAGLLVSSQHVLTAGHVLTCGFDDDASSSGRLAPCAVRLVTESRSNEERISKASELAKCAVDVATDVGVIELEAGWPGWAREDTMPLVQVLEEKLDSLGGFAYWGFQLHHKGEGQQDYQGLHERRATLDNKGHICGGHRSILTQPRLPAGYSGSPLITTHCGMNPWCVVGLLSAKSERTDSDGACGVPLGASAVRKFLSSFGIGVESYRNPYSGARLALVPMVEFHISEPLRGVAAGGALKVGYETELNRSGSKVGGLSASLGVTHFATGQLQTYLTIPGSGDNASIPGVASSASTSLITNIAIEYVPNARSRLPIVAELGPVLYWTWVQGDGSTGSPSYVFSLGARSRLALRNTSTPPFSFEVGISWTALQHRYTEYGFSLVPGELTKRSATATGIIIGVDLTTSWWWQQ